jgi:hypothetical protein
LYSLCRLSDPKRAIAAVNEVIRFQPANAGALAARASLNARLGLKQANPDCLRGLFSTVA